MQPNRRDRQFSVVAVHRALIADPVVLQVKNQPVETVKGVSHPIYKNVGNYIFSDGPMGSLDVKRQQAIQNAFMRFGTLFGHQATSFYPMIAPPGVGDRRKLMYDDGGNA
jgi:hypothetical protein